MEIYVFGSITSGDVDAGSDVDVLAIVEAEETRALPNHWSVYRRERIHQLFARGTLFAWHLHKDARLVFPCDREGLIESLGEPAPYLRAEQEIEMLMHIARDACRELAAGTPSPVYELGLLFVASRDVAMAAAPCMSAEFVFSRFAPYGLQTPSYPLDRSDYEVLMACRRASTRGGAFELAADALQRLAGRAEDILAWLYDVKRRVNECKPS